MPPRLIINADDFGLTPGINRAIFELHHAGVVTSATLMATGPAFDDAVALALANPTLGVGCHLVLVDGIPISHPQSIPTLLGADGKTFRPSILDFAQASKSYEQQIRKLAGFAVDCDDGGTHIDIAKRFQVAPSAWAFLKSHPFGVSPEPYAGGLPAGFPSYCSIVP